MKNIIAYYYSLYPDEIVKQGNSYFFSYFDSDYVFEPFNRPLSDAQCLFEINKQMISRNILVHEIILNNDQKILTYVNNAPYVLMEIFINKKASITLSEICYINNNSINIKCDKILNRYDWVSLWETKNDYFEEQISEIGKKYQSLSDYLSYYIGLAENAISYVRNATSIDGDAFMSINHKRIKYNESLFDLYNPTRMVLDYRVRDFSEYVKSAFFAGENAYQIIEEYFNYNQITYKEALLFYGRLLYPSYFFDVYDDVVNGLKEEKEFDEMLSKADSYELFLLNVYLMLSTMFRQYIPPIDWIIKRSYV